MIIPQSTYRIQFSSGFTFSEFSSRLLYLHRLGISTVYASPIFRSVKGSSHGYDGLDPHSINEEIGTREQLSEISSRVNWLGMGWLQDIVPNHMAYRPENPWIFQLFEWGEDSPYYHYFDINWNHPDTDLKGKIMLPVLEKTPEQLIGTDEIFLKFKEGRFFWVYLNYSFPLSIRTYPDLLSRGIQKQPEKLVSFMNLLFRVINEKQITFRDSCRNQLNALYLDERTVRQYIDSILLQINRNSERKKDLLQKQYYKLSHWMETNRRLNYRRFFTINDLICLRMEDPVVFEDYHSEIKKLIQEGVFQGLRIDHADGLFSPRAYLNRLRQLVGEECYIITEKILETEEKLPRSWSVEGTSGYDFLSLVNNLLTNEESEREFEEIYHVFESDETDFDELVYQKKKFILLERMHGDLGNLTHLFFELSLALQPVTRDQIEAVLAEFLVLCPVYKIYPETFPIKGRHSLLLKSIFEEMRFRIPEQESVIVFLENLFDLKIPGAEEKKAAIEFFFRRCMQFTGPVMAKGVEDTSFYTYARFIAHNEVGDSPRHFGITASEFHNRMRERFMYYPYTMNTTSTHDTKRGEDARARLLVLSDIPYVWRRVVLEWKEMNQEKKTRVKGQPVPVPKDEYFIYQSLIGAFPLDQEEEESFQERFSAFIIKALREAKENSAWVSPNEEYEQGTLTFITQLLDPELDFYHRFRHFLDAIAGFGMLNSLIQVILKHTCPGVPDTYQGCELWDFSMVDPDNRRPVDYDKRERWLTEIRSNKQSRAVLFDELLSNWHTGKVKLAITAWLLEERNRYPHLFSEADYIPLKVTGTYNRHILAFLRQHEEGSYLIAVPLYLAFIAGDYQKLPLFDWIDTAIILPWDGIFGWRHLFSGKSIRSASKIPILEIFDKNMPFAVCKKENQTGNMFKD
jgi:malto-oligosyltrehalose synthase